MQRPLTFPILASCALLAACQTRPLDALVQAAPAAEKTVTNYYDGLVVQTANVYGTIDVRARSYGPGLCNTEITVGTKKVSINAPPAVYGGWTAVESHSGAFSFPVGKRDNCDTGTEVQVRYFKR